MNPRVSSTTPHQVCLKYSSQGVRGVPHFVAPALATVAPFHFRHFRLLRLPSLSALLLLLPAAPIRLLLVVPIRLLCYVSVRLRCSGLGFKWWLIRRLFFITKVDCRRHPRCLLFSTLPFEVGHRLIVPPAFFCRCSRSNRSNRIPSWSPKYVLLLGRTCL